MRFRRCTCLSGHYAYLQSKAWLYVLFSELTSISQLGKDAGRLLPTPVSTDWSSAFNRVQSDETLVTIEEMGFMVGIGVATGADSIFIAKDLPSKVEKELLLPALNARDMSGNRLQYLANTC